jgi:hypothetical protein
MVANRPVPLPSSIERGSFFESSCEFPNEEYAGLMQKLPLPTPSLSSVRDSSMNLQQKMFKFFDENLRRRKELLVIFVISTIC